MWVWSKTLATHTWRTVIQDQVVVVVTGTLSRPVIRLPQ